MAKKSKGQSLLENAYKLATPDDNQTYYDEFASSYDADFATALGWHYPMAIASVYRNAAMGHDRPIADIGCGTGLVAEALGCAPKDIDGIDISDEMLAKAKEKRPVSLDHQRPTSPARSPLSGMTTAPSYPRARSPQDILARNRLSHCWTLRNRARCSRSA